VSAFASVRERMIAAGMVDGTTGRLTAAGIAYADCIIEELKHAPPPPDGERPHRGARLPGVKWNTKRKQRG
jgi:hypothetical protein